MDNQHATTKDGLGFLDEAYSDFIHPTLKYWRKIDVTPNILFHNSKFSLFLILAIFDWYGGRNLYIT
eukprot:Pgem_evm2s2643